MISHHARQLLGRPIRLTAGCDAACTVTARGSLTIRPAGSGQAATTAAVARTATGVLRPNRTSIAAGERVRLALRLRHGAVKRAFPLVRRGAIAELRVRLTATGAAGTTVSPPLRFRLLLPPGSGR
ncbi:MAG TPA: hypothetical protein VHA54_04550 [Solirubrobacterales bacterium]|nr:hypothetical protein [Solirubrobacterales bacterium]